MTFYKHIPNAITSLNLLSGLLGILFAIKGQVDMALYAMLAAAIFDFLDGFSARLLNAYSDIGKELDSLADLISFGVLPAIMLHIQMKMSLYSDNIFCYIPLLVAVFSALRLASFNIDTRQTKSFLGLPTPACALFCAALCGAISHEPSSSLAIWSYSYFFMPIVSIVLCILLVSEIPMFSLKFSKDDTRAVRIKRLAFAILIAASVVFCLVKGLHFSVAILISLAIYILKNLVYCIVKI